MFSPAKGNGRFVEMWPCLEHAYRVKRLIERGLTVRAATIVVDAAMLGEGCIEGTVRAEIQARMNARGDDDHGIR